MSRIGVYELGRSLQIPPDAGAGRLLKRHRPDRAKDGGGINDKLGRFRSWATVSHSQGLLRWEAMRRRAAGFSIPRLKYSRYCCRRRPMVLFRPVGRGEDCLDGIGAYRRSVAATAFAAVDPPPGRPPYTRCPPASMRYSGPASAVPGNQRGICIINAGEASLIGGRGQGRRLHLHWE